MDDDDDSEFSPKRARAVSTFINASPCHEVTKPVAQSPASQLPDIAENEQLHTTPQLSKINHRGIDYQIGDFVYNTSCKHKQSI